MDYWSISMCPMQRKYISLNSRKNKSFTLLSCFTDNRNFYFRIIVWRLELVWSNFQWPDFNFNHIFNRITQFYFLFLSIFSLMSLQLLSKHLSHNPLFYNTILTKSKQSVPIAISFCQQTNCKLQYAFDDGY